MLAQMMKDLDLAEGTDGKISLAPGCKKRLMAEIVADVDFLTSLGVMDYSLLVGLVVVGRIMPSCCRKFPCVYVDALFLRCSVA